MNFMPKKQIIWQNKSQLNKNHWHRSTVQSFQGLIEKFPDWEKNLIIKSGLEFLDGDTTKNNVEDPPEVSEDKEEVQEVKPAKKGRKKTVSKD